MLTGWMTYKASVVNMNGQDVLVKVTRPCQVIEIRDGHVSFKPGTICKRGSFPNIHKYLNTRDSDVITLPVTECVFDDKRNLY